MSADSPPPVPSPATTPGICLWCGEKPRAATSDLYCAECEADRAPSAPPAPAPGELEEWERLLAAVEAAVKRHEREASASSSVSWHVAKEAFRRHCTESRVAQLVAAARDLPALSADYGKLLAESNGWERARDAWREYAEHAAGCVECGQTSWENCDDGFLGPGGKTLREAAIAADAVAARASRPTEETDAT